MKGTPVSALTMTPEEHLAKACDALDRIKSYESRPGVARVAASLSAYATAHLLAAQVKMGMDPGVPYGTYAWEKGGGA